MEEYSDKKIIESWQKNVMPWIKAITNQEIESRVNVTNQAILDTILKLKPANLLDVGCGEGWLIRELSKIGIDCTGIDAIPEFEEYVKASGGDFQLLSYEAFSPDQFKKTFDVIACNFSMLGKESVENVIANALKTLKSGGRLIVQTIHPVEASGEENYTDGWRPGSWKGFATDFVDPAPWYFRTLDSWKHLFTQAGFENITLTETRHPKTTARLSVIFEAHKNI